MCSYMNSCSALHFYLKPWDTCLLLKYESTDNKLEVLFIIEHWCSSCLLPFPQDGFCHMPLLSVMK